MQTFMPFDDFYKCAVCLDNKRLNKQIVEAYQIITGRVPNKNHPACLMWDDSKSNLYEYIMVCCDEYQKRTNKGHSVYEKIQNIDLEITSKTIFDIIIDKYKDLFLLSHKVNLLRKDYTHYSNFFTVKYELDSYPEGYYWPRANGKVSKIHTQNWLLFFDTKGVD